jgi:glycosyltransferase involved in cell wall biosynthesis
MASGTYCIATRVGGIPELLDDEWLIDANSPEQLAEAIEKSIDNPSLVTKQVEQNLVTVRDYAEDKLKLRRENFYNELKRISV